MSYRGIKIEKIFLWTYAIYIFACVCIETTLNDISSINILLKLIKYGLLVILVVTCLTKSMISKRING